MKLKSYVRLWILLSVALAFEAFALNYNSFLSGWALLKENVAAFKDLNLSPVPGKSISLWYGWTGLSLMLLTNLYILRKRWNPLKKLGNLPGWLDFHIFCGLLGPTFILFHSNFKVGGLVAISFWSMVVSFSSGVIGRYFYMQLARQKTELQKDADSDEKILQQLPAAATIAEGGIEQLGTRVIQLAGGGTLGETGVFTAVARSFVGDLRLRFGMGKMAQGLTPEARGALKRYAKTKRRIEYLSQFQQVMGYWHTFHMPFAVFMYLVAVIHVAVALLLHVGR